MAFYLPERDEITRRYFSILLVLIKNMHNILGNVIDDYLCIKLVCLREASLYRSKYFNGFQVPTQHGINNLLVVTVHSKIFLLNSSSTHCIYKLCHLKCQKVSHTFKESFYMSSFDLVIQHNLKKLF